MKMPTNNFETPAALEGGIRRKRSARIGNGEPKPIIRYFYYGFIFSIPFESVDVGIRVVGTIPKLIGVLFIIVTVLQPRLCWRMPPKVFWLFATYLYLHSVWGIFFVLSGSELSKDIILRFLTLFQLLVLFWVSYNILQYKRVVKGSLLTLVASCTIVGGLIVAGLSAEEAARATVGEANANLVGVTLALGTLALVGLKQGFFKGSAKLQLLFWPCFGLMTIGLVRTGSRGALLALVGALLIFPLIKANLAMKIKMSFAIVVGIVVLVIASYQIDAVRLRWEKTLTQGDLSGRQEIYYYAFEMFKEQPLGWGPMRNRVELGSRLGLPERDIHNLYLYLLTEVGVLGTIPFLFGLWMCFKAAWRARRSFQGALPLALLLLFLAVNLKGTYLHKKFFWFVLAYSLASATFVVSPARHYAYLRARPKNLGAREAGVRAV